MSDPNIGFRQGTEEISMKARMKPHNPPPDLAAPKLPYAVGVIIVAVYSRYHKFIVNDVQILQVHS